MRWNLRLAAAQRDIWKASELQRMLADAGLVISAGKMSNLWSGQPVTIRLDDLDVICEVLGCEPGDLLVREPGKARRDQPADDVLMQVRKHLASTSSPSMSSRRSSSSSATKSSHVYRAFGAVEDTSGVWLMTAATAAAGPRGPAHPSASASS